MSNPGLSGFVGAVVLVAGSVSLSAPARADVDTGAARSLALNAVPSAPCLPQGATAADKAIAKSLRPAMNGRRLGRSVSAQSISCARAIVLNVQARALDRRAAVIAVTTAIAESTLHNYTVAVDHDSLGLFQQRPSTGWGRPDQLVDPGYATRAFLNALIRKHPSAGWLSGDIGQICQRVQGSAFPEAYAPEVHDARLIVESLWSGSSATATSPATPTATPTATPAKAKVKVKKGPFQRSLFSAGTGRGTTDARHDVSAADWNADGRADLIVVQRADTGSGRTELYILDGAPNFQRLLLHTGTVLGLTDERYTFSMADWNADGKLDLVVVQKSGTASGRTELRVIDGASSYQRYLLETATVSAPTDDRHSFSAVDWNADGRMDLATVQKSGTASGRTEVRVLDGASNFQTYLQETATALGPLDDRHEVAIADWNKDRHFDLVVMQKSGTSNGRTELRILDGASKFRRSLVRTSTAEGTTDDRHDLSIADWNGDGRLDLVVVQKSDTASGRTEARVFSG